MAMTADSRRLQGSAVFAFTLHAAVLGLYLYSTFSKAALQTPILREVEFMDLKPAPVQVAHAAPAQVAPKSLTDFLKMALPKFSSPQEAPSAPKEVFREMPSSAKLLVDKGALQRGPSLKIDSPQLARGSAASLADIARRPDAHEVAPLDMAAPKTIALDAVGRRAVASAGPAIRIEGTAGPARTGMRDLPSVPRGATSGTGMAAAPSGLDLREGATPVRRAAGFPGGGPSIGYSKGSGISLAEGPVGRPMKTAALPAAPAPSKPQPTADIVIADSKKAVEITGPLAGRKVISMVLPAYPDWAKAKGIQADVLIRFFVGPDGRVQERMLIERTSGYKELDDICMEALQKIVFIPLPAGSKEEQWGIITFRFRLT